MKDLDNIRHLFKLKEISRTGKVNGRNESTAEHTWSTMILAEYFLKKVDAKVDRCKVLTLLLYHDITEIELGDIFILDEKRRKDKPQKEREALETLKTKIPSELVDDFHKAFTEFEENKTIEARFAQAIDKIEPMIHWLHDKPAWKHWGFNETNLREKKQKYMEVFPELLDFFNGLMDYLKEHDYI